MFHRNFVPATVERAGRVIVRDDTRVTWQCRDTFATITATIPAGTPIEAVPETIDSAADLRAARSILERTTRDPHPRVLLQRLHPAIRRAAGSPMVGSVKGGYLR